MREDILQKLSEKRGNRFGLRMAPMIDMVFLLLIFFLVTAKWRPEENFLPFQLPLAQGQGAGAVKPEPLTIRIEAAEDGCAVGIAGFSQVRIEAETIEENLAFLAEQLDACLKQQKRFASDPVEIICEDDVKWEYLAKIYNILYGAGLSDITFSVTQ